MRKQLQYAAIVAFVMCCAAMFAGPAMAQMADENFAMKAAAAGAKEVELGRWPLGAVEVRRLRVSDVE